MAIGLIFEQPGMTQAQYEQVCSEVCPGNVPAPGMLYHAAGTTDQGLCVIEIWESQEAAKRFFDDKLGQALEKAHVSAQPKFFQVVNTMQTLNHWPTVRSRTGPPKLAFEGSPELVARDDPTCIGRALSGSR